MDNRLMRVKSQSIREKGQIILLLVLVMTVALAIGLSVIQRSLSDISTASKVEQSSRAYSAAEAGIEKALGTGSTAPFSLPNNSQVAAGDTGLIPCIPGKLGCAQAAGDRQVPLEYFELAKEYTAHFWLADLNSPANPPSEHYKQNRLDIYWGNSTTDRAALELTLVYYDSSASLYRTRKWYLDQIARTPANNFDTSATCTGFRIGTDNNFYQCRKILGDGTGTNNGSLPGGLMLVRARLLYNSTSQPLAAQAAVVCPSGSSDCRDYSLPPQARVYSAIGTSGTTQRKVRLQQELKVVPPYFDYAIFSADTIAK